MPDETPKRRTLQEVIQEGIEARTKRKGLRCPKCGCPDLQVRVTWASNHQIKRRRVCHNCGTVVPTFETAM